LNNRERDVFMPKQSKMRRKRIRNLIVIFSLTAVILSVSTYAWFIGMRTVNVSSFDVEIASTDSLLLSLNGQNWDTTVQISQATVKTASYADNTNSWGGAGLFPVSSIGTMDVKSSRMQLFEKASLTTTPGGYRLMASRVKNYKVGEEALPAEQDGYVAFDLFVKNFSGTQYLEALEPLDEEAIYLTTDSAVKVASAGAGGVANTGIENSVRVAFAQIGRVAGTTTDVAKITGINCNANAESKPSIANGVTGICRTAQIWEPNDKAHVLNAISWYNTSCDSRKSTGTLVNETGSYNVGGCGVVADDHAYPTYAVSTDITSGDNVDVYDGAEYNTYTASAKLTAFPYFTDTMKGYTGTARPTFMTLSPNSITKIRIYIYIEGQDIDNYDFASIGKKISVNFGFTKERYTEDDINYETPTIPDTERPVISLEGSDPMTLAVGGTYVEPGATAKDARDGDIATENIAITGTVNTAEAGTYTITYTVTDAAGNVGTKTRTVIVK